MKRKLAAGIVLAALSSATALVSADAATSNPAPQQAKAGTYRVTASVSKTEPLLNSNVRINATVRPAAPGAAVTLQVNYEGRKGWKTIDHGRLNGAGKVTFQDKVASVRERRYRVVKPAGSGRGAGQGTTPKVTVFGWRDLTSIPPATASGMTKVDNVNFNGVAFPNSLRSYPTYPPGNGNTIDYNLNRDCKKFRGRAGLDDSSPISGTALVQMATDGTSRYSGSFALTQSAPVAFSVTNVFRLRIAAATTNFGLAAVGTPQVLCSF
jgi:NPCBM/NEW2 domain